MNTPISLSQIPGVWRGGVPLRVEAMPTGHAGLDALLPGSGFPLGALSEILHAHPGVGEMSLVLPMLARQTQAGSRVALVGPPHIPFAPAFDQAGLHLPRVIVAEPPAGASAHWGVEQFLRSGVFACVVAWSGQTPEQELRRLQLAAEDTRSICVLMRPLSVELQPSPAALRLKLLRQASGLDVEVIKARGGSTGRHWRAA